MGRKMHQRKITQYRQRSRATIKDCYSICIESINKRMEGHLGSILKRESKGFKLLFEEKIDGKTLYDLRHVIAHGFWIH